eukprot:scaffold466543_cov39-Prasinocladus_malaysianus.AAC.1
MVRLPPRHRVAVQRDPLEAQGDAGARRCVLTLHGEALVDLAVWGGRHAGQWNRHSPNLPLAYTSPGLTVVSQRR